jgi:hypothetical protein
MVTVSKQVVKLTSGAGNVVIVMGSEVAGLLEVQRTIDEVQSTETWSPLTGMYVNTALVALFALTALIFHWYAGVEPPCMAAAVKVTAVPSQTGFAEAETETPTGSGGLTVIVMGSEVAGLLEVQSTIDEVQSTETWSSLTGV